MRVIAAAVTVALLAGPALGQQQAIPKYGEAEKEKTLQQKQADKAAEAAYKRSLGNIPEQKPTDPWGNVRGDNSSKAEATAPAKKTKTGASPN